MADISKIKLIDGTEYDVKDYVARQTDLTLSPTSERPLANRILYNLMPNFVVNWRQDDETGLVYLTNYLGQDIGDGLDLASTKTYKPKITNLMSGPVLTYAGGSQVVLSYNYTSVDENLVGDGPGTGILNVNGTETQSFNVPQGNNTYDVSSLLTAGVNSVKLKITNSEGTPRTFTYTVIILTLSLVTNVTSPNAYYGDFVFSYVLTGYGDKTVHFAIDGTELTTQTVSTSGAVSTRTIPAQTAGPHTLTVWAVVVQDNITVTSNTLTIQMMYSSTALPDISVASGQHVIRYFNYDGTYLYGYAATDGQAAINPVTSSLITAPTKSGTSTVRYVFDGWSDLPSSVSKDCAVTAKYVTEYKVVFMNNNAVYDSKWVAHGEDSASPDNAPTKEETASKAYVFAGWNADNEATTPDSDALKNVTATRIVYAIFTELNKYTVRFLAENGTTVLQTSTVLEGATPSYTGNTPTSATEGYIFTGWLPAIGAISANTDYVAQFKDGNTETSKYLKRTMTAYETTGATTVGQYAFYQYTTLQTVETDASTIEQYAFYGCTNLTEVNLTSTGAVSIAGNAFNGCTKLAHLIISSTTASTLSATSALTGTKIASGLGAIYVPANLVDTYKAASNWSTYASQIYPITAYPVTDFSTISDSWSNIIANPTYSVDYVVGDTKKLDLGSKGEIYMELIAIDTDDKADNSGKARMTWLSKPIIETYKMNATQKTVNGETAYTAGGWENTDLRAYLKDTIKPLIPQEIREAIVPVTKISSTYTGGALVKDGQTTTDDVWIPSHHEIFNTTSNETTGPVYSTKFSDSASRIKYNASGSASIWWLRSAGNASGFRGVGSDGGGGSNVANSTVGLVLGFCT